MLIQYTHTPVVYEQCRAVFHALCMLVATVLYVQVVIGDFICDVWLPQSGVKGR